jgi:hypothetical protein
VRAACVARSLALPRTFSSTAPSAAIEEAGPTHWSEWRQQGWRVASVMEKVIEEGNTLSFPRRWEIPPELARAIEGAPGGVQNLCDVVGMRSQWDDTVTGGWPSEPVSV